MRIEGEQSNLGLDFDGTMVNVIYPLMLWLQSNFPNKFTKVQFLNENPNPGCDFEYFLVQRIFMKDATFIPAFRPYYSVVPAMPLLKRNFSGIYINSLRWTSEDPNKDQKPYIEQLLERHRLSEYIPSSNILLRQAGDERTGEVKLENALKHGIDYMVEDDPRVAILLSQYLRGVILVRRPWNKHEPSNAFYDLANRENMVICGGLGDFAMGVDLYGGPENFFASHAERLQDPAYLNRVYKAPTSQRDRLVVVASGESSLPCLIPSRDNTK